MFNSMTPTIRVIAVAEFNLVESIVMIVSVKGNGKMYGCVDHKKVHGSELDF